jgi:putative transposase
MLAHYLQTISLGVGSMVFHVIMFLWDFLLDLVAIVSLSNDAKDLEILLLRQQLRIVERKQKRGPIIPRWQKIPLAVLAIRLKQKADNASDALAQSIFLFKPETLISWHRDLVRRKWTFDNRLKSGRPPISSELEKWIVKIAQNNPTFGYDKIEGELRKIGFQISATTIRTVLQQHGIPPAPQRCENSTSWRTFLNHYQQQFLACDFFTIETLTLQTIYVLFFIEHATRRVHFAGCTSQPKHGSPNKLDK